MVDFSLFRNMGTLRSGFVKLTLCSSGRVSKRSSNTNSICFFLYSQRDTWHHAHSIIWPNHSILNFSLPCYSHSATAFRCCWSFTIIVKLSSTYLAMRRHCEHRPRKWTWNHWDRIKKVLAIQPPKCALPRLQSQFAFYLLLVSFCRIRFCICSLEISMFEWYTIFQHGHLMAQWHLSDALETEYEKKIDNKIHFFLIRSRKNTV